jgi:hypothetical protein
VLWAPLWAAFSAGVRVKALAHNGWLTAGAAIAHNWLVPPPWHAPGPWAMAAVGVGTVIYAGLYLLTLSRFGTGRWARKVAADQVGVYCGASKFERVVLTSFDRLRMRTIESGANENLILSLSKDAGSRALDAERK